MEEIFTVTQINRIVMVGKDEYPTAVTSFDGNLESHEIIFHFSGQSTVYFGDAELKTKPGVVRFLPKGDHGRYDVVRHTRGECILVSFLSDRAPFDTACVIDVKQNEKIGALFKKIFATWVGRGDGYYFDSLSLLYKIFAELQRKNYVPKAHYEKIKPAIDEIHENFLSEELYVDDLAKKCGIGEAYLQRLFKKKFGISPVKYIIQLKINHACDLLRFERYSVSAVAQMCNFSNVYFFSTQFKEYVGLTPTQFAKKYKSSK